MRAVGYYRPHEPAPSNPASGSEFHGPSPRAEIERFCAEESHNLVDVIRPDGSNGSDSAQFERLLGSLTGPGALPVLVVIPDTGHLASDLETLVERLLAIDGADADVRCAEIDLPDPLQNGLERLGLKGRKAATARRVRDSILAKAARGEVVGRTPYGYTAALDGTLTPVPEEAAVVREVFDLYAGPRTGGDEAAERPDEGMGLRRISAELLAQGRTTRHGNPWSPVALAGMLRNRAYVGTYSRHGFRLASSHEPLVERDRFNRVQELLARRKPRRRVRARRVFPLGSIARCALCGRALHGLTRTRRWRRRSGESVERSYCYYECPARVGSADEHPSWRADALESAVLGQLGSLVASRPHAQVTDPGAPEGRELVARAERDFMQIYRSTAAGRGTIQSLAGSLNTVTEARRDAAVSADAAAATAGHTLMAARSGDRDTASRAMRALLERVVATDTDVELFPRF